MKLGAFSISLAVKDLAISRAFYEKLGFSVFGGNQAERWLIMKNETTLVGLFQGMFEKNLLTFTPGWDAEATLLPAFDDVREIHRRLQAAGIGFATESITSSTGPGHFIVVDPDGNQILVDQHV